MFNGLKRLLGASEKTSINDDVVDLLHASSEIAEEMGSNETMNEHLLTVLLKRDEIRSLLRELSIDLSLLEDQTAALLIHRRRVAKPHKTGHGSEIHRCLTNATIDAEKHDVAVVTPVMMFLGICRALDSRAGALLAAHSVLPSEVEKRIPEFQTEKSSL